MNAALTPPVSARSAVLSLLLGVHPPELSAREIVTAMQFFGVSESAVRVAMSRMVAAGDLLREGAVYRLSPRLIERQQAAAAPAVREWNGTWEMAVVTTSGRSAADRVALRDELARQRVAELREGVWTRPANLRRGWPDRLLEVSTCFEARPVADAVDLAGTLWDLTGWSRKGHAYLDALAKVGDEPSRFVTMVAAVRHLQTDPLLPAELLPSDWPGRALQDAYDDYRDSLAVRMVVVDSDA